MDWVLGEGVPVTGSVGASALTSQATSVIAPAASAVGVIVGGALVHYFPLIWIKRAAAITFIAIGLLILLGKL